MRSSWGLGQIDRCGREKYRIILFYHIVSGQTSYVSGHSLSQVFVINYIMYRDSTLLYAPAFVLSALEDPTRAYVELDCSKTSYQSCYGPLLISHTNSCYGPLLILHTNSPSSTFSLATTSRAISLATKHATR